MSSSSRRFVLAVAATTAVGAVLVAALFVVRGMTYRWTVQWSSGLPEGAQQVFAAVAGSGLIALLAVVVVATLVARSRGLLHLARGVAAGAAVVLAYLASEGIKLLVTQLRPCRNFAVSTISSCPEVGDWAWPSNHATIATALAASVVVMAPRFGVLAAPLAAAICLSRVVVGVHYFHDVLAGAFLAVVVVALVVRLGSPTVLRGMRAAISRSTLLASLLQPGVRARAGARTGFRRLSTGQS